jgi:non-ribosomal peptide synthetase component F
LRVMSRDAGVTMFMTLLAVFQVVLARFTGQDDLLIGIPAAGRTVPQAEGLIGFFVNMLALRADLTDDPTFTQLLTRVREHTLSGLAHQDLPFERLVSAVNPERDGDMHPLIQVTFQIFEEQADHALRLTALRAKSVSTGMRGSRYDLSFDVFLDEDGLRYWITYDERFFDSGQIESFGAAFQALIPDMLANPGQPVSQRRGT